MITTWQIIQDGIETFTPVINRTTEIGLEFTNYFLYIAIWILGVRILREAVKYILAELKEKSENTMQSRRRRRRRQRRMKTHNQTNVYDFKF